MADGPLEKALRETAAELEEWKQSAIKQQERAEAAETELFKLRKEAQRGGNSDTT